MGLMTLHRASRVQGQIRAAIGALSVESHARISIFTDEANAEVERLSQRLMDDIARLQRLLSILADLRAAVGQQNIASGIGRLLAEKAAIEEEISLLSKLVGGHPERPSNLDFLSSRRRREQAVTTRGRVSLEAQIRASRARFEAGENGDDTIRVPLLDAGQHDAIRTRIRDRRRRLDAIADKLRALNSTGTVEIADEALAFLEQAGVV